MSSSTSSYRAPPSPKAPPATGRYRLSALLNVPNRLIHPGALIEKYRQTPLSLQGATAGVVRGKRVKLCQVTLDDMIAGEYTPPISLKDFEDYLCFRTKSAENLYFEIWLREYTALYNKAVPATRNHKDLMALSEAYQLAIQTFFDTRSPLELNVASDLRRQLDAKIRSTAHESILSPSLENFLPPSAFDQVHHESSESLATSFKAFLVQAARNADRNRARFAMFLGALTWVLGLIPTIVCAVLDKHRGFRAIGLPLWWFGTVVFVGGLRRTCLVIYLFGDSRQLYPWELARETDTTSIHFGAGSPETVGWTSPDLESAKNFNGSEKSSPALHSTRARDSVGSFPDLNYFPLGRAASTTQSSSEKSSGGTGSTFTANKSGQVLYFAPASLRENLAPSSKIWEKFTRVTEPIVARAQHEIVMAAAGYGVIVMIITGAICLSVPNRSR